jgi:organic hydroperoxide reductase OsmC/OhrA
MDPFPHTYRARGAAQDTGDVELSGDRLPALHSASPAEFGGPGDRWSPETLLVGAIADCFILTFRTIARAASLPWTAVDCEVLGTLDRIDRVTQFVHFDVRARLVVPNGTDVSQARTAMERAEHRCLISRSLKGRVHLETHVELQDARTILATWEPPVATTGTDR